MLKIPTLEELLDAGAHFGHRESKGHPKMKPFVYSVNGGIQIIDLEKTIDKLTTALDFIKEKAKEGKTILFLGTKSQSKKIIKENAEKIKMPCVTERWLGGTLTNFSEVSKLMKKLKKLENNKKEGEFEKYTKREQTKLNEEIEKLTKMVGGIKGLERLPSIVFAADIRKDKIAVTEAQKSKIPIVAIVDTNVNPDKIDYPIPANDDGIKSLKLIIGLVTEAYEEGLKEKQSEPEKPVKKEEKEIKKPKAEK